MHKHTHTLTDTCTPEVSKAAEGEDGAVWVEAREAAVALAEVLHLAALEVKDSRYGCTPPA